MPGKRAERKTDLSSLAVSDILPSKTGLSAAVRRPVPNSTYASIVKSIGLYLCLAEAERNAVPRRRLITKLKQLNKAAASIRSDLTKSALTKVPDSALFVRRTFGEEETAYEALQAILKRLPKKIPPKTLVSGAPADLPAVRPSFDAVRTAIFQQLLDGLLTLSLWMQEEEKWVGPRSGTAWEFWIVIVTAIMRRDGLPYQVSKATTNPNAQVSPFVKFVHALQSRLPEDFREHMHSDDALSQAIVRARKGNKFESADIDGIFELMLTGRRRSGGVFIG